MSKKRDPIAHGRNGQKGAWPGMGRSDRNQGERAHVPDVRKRVRVRIALRPIHTSVQQTCLFPAPLPWWRRSRRRLPFLVVLAGQRRQALRPPERHTPAASAAAEQRYALLRAERQSCAGCALRGPPVQGRTEVGPTPLVAHAALATRAGAVPMPAVVAILAAAVRVAVGHRDVLGRERRERRRVRATRTPQERA